MPRDECNRPGHQEPDPYTLEGDLISQAIACVSGPDTLPGTPLDRLNATTTPAAAGE